MDIILVYSYWGKKASAETLDMAYISNYLAQKQGYKTVLYIDKKNKEEFINKIPYSEVVEFDDNILEQLPPAVWSAGKILAASIETRPFLHVDFDLFILNNKFYDYVKNEEFITYHYEPWWSLKTEIGKIFHKEALKYFIKNTDNAFKLDYSKDLDSYNCAIFGSCKKENIEIINKECQFIIKALIKSKNIIQNPEFIRHITYNSFKNGGIPVIVEQVIMIYKIHNKLKSHSSIIKINHGKETFEEGLKFGLLHLWGAKKVDGIKKLLKNKVKKLNI